ncbi:16S rRNA (uracil(1498)-N(3))-methyltransferase [Cognatazoarcus halotolerans]|uniref:16S rRNA (uracil(1498)-N(3))-methyltransferase n=1 Tax=Cognatazoarcus halotolerans TaxID=2686016 RepID=UPI00135C3B80|nr:16S rRNA (uracil(1498)-N(3))-methyltransferase [Cognatazoarcus halotolerans]MBX3680143.1 16S rRNA (uracil(1498)-N(3))-methyltransferase [Rhodocyclaceae bacterium]MCB1898321.1 16S rRNA (uracil(1498)-N(3))-methyltransferase [Rhodocyclaceae bacterium]MCP5308481.1 16S rRNA (uracil(1498)-N(3))-methyltransferase [Zoogloeaceae bacterium]
MISRFFCPPPLPENQDFELPADVAHHAERVLRLRPGDSLVLFDGEGGEVPGILVAVGKSARARLAERRSGDRESPIRITLVQALASGDKMDLIIQKAVELGAAAVIPVVAERSVLKLSAERAEKRLAHWRQVVVSASEQCGRNRLLQLAPVLSLEAYLGSQATGVTRLALVPGEGERLIDMRDPGSGDTHVLVGPEGGWSERELAAICRAGCRPVTLGPRILRTETAGLAALAAAQAVWGDF